MVPQEGGCLRVHTHFSFMAALSAFFGVLVLGTFWRLVYGHFLTSDNAMLTYIGQAMAFQY